MAKAKRKRAPVAKPRVPQESPRAGLPKRTISSRRRRRCGDRVGRRRDCSGPHRHAHGRRDGREVRRQRELRWLPSGRDEALARVATQARHGSCDRKNGPRRLFQCEFHLLWRALALLSRGRKILCRNRRAGRKARRVRGQIYVRGRSAPAISGRIPRSPIQALSLAWDSRPKDKGGQRWFHLYPNEEICHDDVLHWTKLN